MEWQGIYAVIAVSDMARSENWYTRLLGRPADDHPMDWLVQWRQNGLGLQLWRDADKAGHTLATMVIASVAEQKKRLSAAGIELTSESTGDFGAIAHAIDPDGNHVVLAEPPKT